MSKTRCNNEPPPVELLISRHSKFRIVAASGRQFVFHNRKTGLSGYSHKMSRLDEFMSLCRKWAK